MLIERLGDFSLAWGESLVWDDRAERLYFVDCAAQTLHWLVGGRGPLHTISLPSMAAGIVPTEDGRLVGALDDGLHLIDPEAGTTEFADGVPGGSRGPRQRRLRGSLGQPDHRHAEPGTGRGIVMVVLGS